MLKKSLLVLLVLMLLSLPVLAEDQNQVVAVVKGESITLGQLDEIINMNGFIMDLYQMNPQFTQLLFTSPEGETLLNAYRKQQLEQYIDQFVLVLAAKDQGLTLTPEKIDEIFAEQVDRIMYENNITEEQLVAALQEQGIQSLDQYKELFVQNSGDALLIRELQNQVFSAITVSDEEAKAYYESNKDSYVVEAAVHPRHILVSEQAKAEELLAKVKKGGDFAGIAKESSICPSSKDGGDLGFITKGQTVKEFEDAIFGMEVGQISNVVKTQYGYHIIKMEEVRPATTMTYEEAKISIFEELAEVKRQDAWQKYSEDVRKNTPVEIKL